MILFFYTLGLHLWGVLIRLVALFNPKARQWAAGRNGIFEKLKTSRAGTTQPVAWFHCASLGEFEQARPVIENFRIQHPAYTILLTFFSPSGYEIRKDYAQADWVFYLPLDTRSNARKFIEIVRPAIVFFAKYEFWHYYLTELRRRSIPTILFSSIFRPNQAFFQWYGSFFRNMLRCFDHIFVQNNESQVLLQRIGLQNVTVAGDTRIDRVGKIAETKKDIPVAAVFKGQDPLLIVGSAWQGDLDLLLPFLNRFSQPLKVIVAPHEIKEETLQHIEKTLTRKTLRFSSATETTVIQGDVLLIDGIGLLASLYQYGDFAFVGGGFYDGIHSILEPAVFGMPIFFGPDYRKFQEAFDLIDAGAAFCVHNTAEFAALFDELYQNASRRQQLAETARTYIRQSAGATEKILGWVGDNISQ
jgi:3-deoxy-D-manno-octulosonic-acid transferase